MSAPAATPVEAATADVVSLAALRLATEGHRQRLVNRPDTDAVLDRYTRTALAHGGWVDDLRRGLSAHLRGGAAS